VIALPDILSAQNYVVRRKVAVVLEMEKTARPCRLEIAPRYVTSAPGKRPGAGRGAQDDL